MSQEDHSSYKIQSKAKSDSDPIFLKEKTPGGKCDSDPIKNQYGGGVWQKTGQCSCKIVQTYNLVSILYIA